MYAGGESLGGLFVIGVGFAFFMSSRSCLYCAMVFFFLIGGGVG